MVSLSWNQAVVSGLISHLRFGVFFQVPVCQLVVGRIQFPAVVGLKPSYLRSCSPIPVKWPLSTTCDLPLQWESISSALNFSFFSDSSMENGLYLRMRRNWFLFNLISEWSWHLVKIKGLYEESVAFCKAVSMKENGPFLIYNLSGVGRANGVL